MVAEYVSSSSERLSCVAGKTVLLQLLGVILLLQPMAACAAVECEYSDMETSAVPSDETLEERVARLEQDLENLLNQFEQCVDSHQSAASASSSSAAGGAEASSSLAGSDPVQAPLPADSAEGEASAQRSASTETAETVEGEPSREGANSNSPPIPGDIPPGTDDDVLAAQLREAAQASGSEALWNEYRRYKGLPTK